MFSFVSFRSRETMHEMAGVLSGMGKYEEASQMYEEVVGLRRKVLGEDDGDTLETEHEIGCLLAEQQKYQEALSVFEGVYSRRKEALGPQEEDTLESVRPSG